MFEKKVFNLSRSIALTVYVTPKINTCEGVSWLDKTAEKRLPFLSSLPWTLQPSTLDSHQHPEGGARLQNDLPMCVEYRHPPVSGSTTWGQEISLGTCN